ncbi:MAG: flavodoxin family protein [Oscillospiraceae bacterium]|jgi:multimeric flavodoxin WrbA|nr:flavodoxin family protein [Oscillospiraceae bacterium]
MKVIGISGSPRKGGNTERLVGECLREFAERGWAASEFYLSGKTIRPCTGCETCVETGACAITGDDAAALFEELAGCDAVIIGSPVYYRGVTAQLKALFDRSFAYKGRGPLAGKPGGAVAVGRGEGGGQGIVLASIYNYLLSCGALPVPGELNGLSAKADKPGDILPQEKRLRQARVLAQNVMQYAEKLREPSCRKP